MAVALANPTFGGVDVSRQAPSSAVVAATSAYDTTGSAEVQVPPGTTAVEFVVITAAKTGTPTVTFSIEAFNPASGLWDSFLTGVAISTVLTATYTITPYFSAVANVSAQRHVRQRMRIKATHTGTPPTDSMPYTIAAHFGI